eukprot:2804020-Pleurochrysis_carterae.AAC.1
MARADTMTKACRLLSMTNSFRHRQRPVALCARAQIRGSERTLTVPQSACTALQTRTRCDTRVRERNDALSLASTRTRTLVRLERARPSRHAAARALQHHRPRPHPHHHI